MPHLHRRIARIAIVVTALLVAACRLVSREESPFFFIVMADPQFGFFTANQDFARETVNFERAIAAANRLRPAFVVVAGDLTHRQGDSAQIAEYKRIVAQLDRSIPLYSVAGNHDVALPLSPASVVEYRKTYGPDYYTFDRRGIYGIVINSSLIKYDSAAHTEAAAQDAWMRSVLDEAHRAGRKHVMVFQHHPWFLTRADEPDQYYNLPRRPRQEFLDAFRRAGGRYIFAGHYHRNALARDGDVEMITSGPVGKPLGADSSGFRIVTVLGQAVTHRYYPLDSLPSQVELRR
jgi:serine/threonine-protein phosphatase CPPED1